MQNEQELMDELKELYPQHPSKEFKSTTEKMLRMKARDLEKKRKFIRFTTIISSGVFVSIFVFCLLILERDGVNHTFGQSAQTLAKPLVYIYHTHNRESYFPELDVQKEKRTAVSETKNVTLVGKRLSKALNDMQINAIHDNSDIFGVLEKYNKQYTEAYLFSGYYLKKALEDNDSIQMVFDIHRDSSSRSDSTIEINGKSYAKIQFIVSKISINYEQNKQFAVQLHEQLEQRYPGLSRGVIEKGERPANTYNQDLHGNSLLLNIGGSENNLEETYRTADIFAEVIKDTLKKSN